MARLATAVHVHDDVHGDKVFAPGDELPSWASKLITNPKAWADAPDTAAAAKDADADSAAKAKKADKPAEGDKTAAADKSSATPTSTTGKPPMVRSGSDTAAWHSYATKNLGIEVPDGSNRAAIVALVTEYEKAQEA